MNKKKIIYFSFSNFFCFVVFVLLPAHSKRFIVYPVQDYHSFSQRVAKVVVMLFVFFVSSPKKFFLWYQLLLDQFLGLSLSPPSPGRIWYFFWGGVRGGAGLVSQHKVGSAWILMPPMLGKRANEEAGQNKIPKHTILLGYSLYG